MFQIYDQIFVQINLGQFHLTSMQVLVKRF